MNDGVEDTTSKLAELLRNPDDLDKLPSLRGEFTRKKAAIDGQLKHGQSPHVHMPYCAYHTFDD